MPDAILYYEKYEQDGSVLEIMRFLIPLNIVIFLMFSMINSQVLFKLLEEKFNVANFLSLTM
ncbi:hypothetical protein SY86_04485 [Erwinia tracheiphila]|uniref:Uncharacterized protein n=1 Tax=Erwinia tracheiphila TaxID=65700 RepID=A0A0M2KC45_9GAMM|nr:hypothetical protein ETR_01526 [Erwinia tracheiphila PSU-1]KKF34852.1 hypothetical protein SY86_04485 [Erwinia tracheiphila]